MTHTITISGDKKCSACGKTGVVEENRAGLCMACISKLISKKLAAQKKKHAP